MSASFRAAIVYTNSTKGSTHLDTDPLSPGFHSFSTGYNRLAYTIFGTGSSLVIWQVPGWGIGPSYLSNGLASLHDSFKILYFTPRGTPPSSRPLDTAEMSSKHMVEDLETLGQHLKLDSMLLLGHSNGGSIALGYAQQYPSHVDKLLLLGHELQGFDDSATYAEFAIKRKDDPIYTAALGRLQKFKADTVQEVLNEILPFYFANPTEAVPKTLETIQDKPSSWALNHQRAADRDRPTYLPR